MGAGALPFLAAAVKEILDTLERWKAEGLRVATATVVKTERSAPRDPGAMLAVSERGEVAGSVTGGCVEPAVYEEAREVLAGGEPRLRTYGIADDEAFEVGLPCGGTVHIFVDALDETMLTPLAEALREERPIAMEVAISGPRIGAKRLVSSSDGVSGELLARGETAIVETDEGELFVNSFAPRPDMYVFGAVDHAAAVAQVGRFIGYRVTICDARARFATRERFPDVDELVVEWPDRFLSQTPVGRRRPWSNVAVAEIVNEIPQRIAQDDSLAIVVQRTRVLSGNRYSRAVLRRERRGIIRHNTKLARLKDQISERKLCRERFAVFEIGPAEV
jgi:xanthine dehydrogenase accessory factor